MMIKEGPSLRWQENEKLLVEIMDFFEVSHETYGSPRITKEFVNILNANMLITRSMSRKGKLG